MRDARAIESDARPQRELRALPRRKRIELRCQQRARIALLAAKDLQHQQIAADAGLDRRRVSMWRGRFLEGGIGALRKVAP